MPRRLAVALALCTGLLAAGNAAAGDATNAAAGFAGTLSGDNLLEARSGNFPFTQPRDRIDVYDQLNLGYDADRVRVGLRFELEQNSANELTYSRVTQRWAAWQDEQANIRVGHFYTILGRGLVHRSFELPGVVLDFDQARQRSRYSPTRDLDGVKAEGELGPLSGLAFTGAPNAQYTPASDPTQYSRTQGQLTGGQLATRLGSGGRAGATWARFDFAGRRDDFGSGFIELDPARLARLGSLALPVYLEYATRQAPLGEWLKFRTGDDAPHALYASVNAVHGPLALSAEWKDYEGFRNGVNDPPSLVREQTWALLNRNTHVLNSEREEGFQLEGTWTPRPWASITLNRSGAEGLAGHFQESYAEWHAASATPGAWEASLAYDAGRDGRLLPYQQTWCLYGLREIRSGWAVAADFERLSGRNVLNAYHDHYFSVTLSAAERGSAALVWERTTDLVQEDPERPGRPRNYAAAVLSARLSDRQNATLFAGKRRGGRACTAGTCYEVEPFTGAEFRLTSRF